MTDECKKSPEQWTVDDMESIIAGTGDEYCWKEVAKEAIRRLRLGEPKVWQVRVHLYEDNDATIGYFSSLEKARVAKIEADEDWNGPNVASVAIYELEVQ